MVGFLKFRFVVLVTMGLFMVTISGCFKKTAVSKDNAVSVGAVLVLTGPNGLWGTNARKAIRLVAQNRRALGLSEKPPINVVVGDSAGETRLAVSEFSRLASAHNFPIVLGDMLSSTTLAMAPLANQEHVVLIAISASAPAVTAAGPFVYRVWPSDTYEGTVFGRYAFSEGFHRIAIALINNDYGHGLANAFARAFTAQGGEVLGQFTFQDGQKDFRDLVAKVRHTQPAAVYTIGYYENTALVVRALRSGGVTAQLLGTSSSVSAKFIELAESASDGFRAAVVDEPLRGGKQERATVFRKLFKRKYGQEPDWAATHAADAFIVAAVCIGAGARTGDQVKACIDTRRVFAGVTGQLEFNKDGDVVNKPITVKRVRQGEFQNVEQLGTR